MIKTECLYIDQYNLIPTMWTIESRYIFTFFKRGVGWDDVSMEANS